ncbi:MAG: chromosomal replication initiation protein [Candidatus Cloacimonetes bacterium 4572_65]|nr:MAG: chromosomal replication initiation protein [Candidatus Cloacimonetes bacterium 4572_65]
MDQDIWQNILDELEEHVAPQSFKTWFSETRLTKFEDNILYILTPTKVASDYLNKNYANMISEMAFNIYHQKFQIKFINDSLVLNKKTIKKSLFKGDLKDLPPLNSRYTFEQFVNGRNSNFAYSAALGVAEAPGMAYNPLFIYGESGMGKTHLMQAVGNYLLEFDKNKIIYYISSEEFTNQMIESIRNNSMATFRQKFRHVDILLVDDIHFLSRKESTQEEFFHTFNALTSARKQIILTSDRSPKDIPDLENRLVTRFESGLVADLKNPDFETRIAILKKKADNQNIYINNDIIEYIADHISSSVRALEGSLIRILAYASYNKIDPADITRDLVLEVLADMISDKPKDITLDSIVDKVCAFYNITRFQIMDKTRKKNIAFPRQVAMYLVSLLIPQVSLKEIAGYFNRKDHTTVLHAKKMIDNKFKNDNDLRIDIESLIKDLKK